MTRRQTPPASRRVDIAQPVMKKNAEHASANRKLLQELGIFTINLISSPGSGKTTLLEAMAGILGDKLAVVVGDIQTRRDADRVAKSGVKAVQIETGGACHLDARCVGDTVQAMDLGGSRCKVLVIENVGNLVCPASYDLGENMKMALLSCPEGDDKVLKYPGIFSRIDALLLTKIDLLPHMDFDTDRAIRECRALNDAFDVFHLSGKTGEGVDAFCEFLLEQGVTRQPSGAGPT